MINKPILTIAIIAYKVERYIAECLESAICQKGDDIEIIVVDDASPDKTGIICDKYARKDKRIKAIHHSKNRGPSGARNTCIENANGKWITFVDGDDMLTDDAVVIMRSYMNTKSDIVFFQFNIYNIDGSIENREGIYKPFVFSEETDLLKYRKSLIGDSQEQLFDVPIVSSVAKMLNVSFLKRNQLKFEERLIFGEDMLFALKCSYEVNRIQGVSRVMYVYRKNANSSTERYDINANKYFYDILLHIKMIIDENDEMWEGVERAFSRRCIQQFLFGIRLSVYHPKCHLCAIERRKRLKKICEQKLIFSAADYLANNFDERDIKVTTLIKNNDIKGLDKLFIYEKRIKRKEQLVKKAFFRKLYNLKKFLKLKGSD